jgi:hypothetical protein
MIPIKYIAPYLNTSSRNPIYWGHYLLVITTIKKWIRVSELTGVFTYPIALTSGFLLGGWVGSGLPVEQFMSLPYVVIAYALSIAFMTPLCFIITRLLFRIFYGRYLKQMEKNINELKNE